MPGDRVKRKLNSADVINSLTDLFIIWGVPFYIGLDNGPAFIADAVRQWIKAVGAQTAYLEPGRGHHGRVDIASASMHGSVMYS